jgi:hypothetical protein
MRYPTELVARAILGTTNAQLPPGVVSSSDVPGATYGPFYRPVPYLAKGRDVMAELLMQTDVKVVGAHDVDTA